MPIRQSVAAALLLSLCAILPVIAAPTTTGTVGDVADFLFRQATCQDFIAALAHAEDANQSTREILITLLGVVYIEGYAAGAGNSSGRRADIILRCTLHPEQPFNTVVPGQ